MKNLFILIFAVLLTVSHAVDNYGITCGGTLGAGLPFNVKYNGDVELGWLIRPALTIGSDNKFAIGVEYSYKYQNETKDNYFDNIIAESRDVSSHNIGLSFATTLSKTPFWYTFGYDTYTNGPFVNVNMGFYSGPDNYNANMLLSWNVYLSSNKLSTGITVSFQWFNEYYNDNTSSHAYYPSYTPTYTAYSSYTTDTDYYSDDDDDDTPSINYNSYYSPDTTTSSYYGGNRVYVRGHYRHYKSGKVSYVRPHTRSYPGTGRRRK